VIFDDFILTSDHIAQPFLQALAVRISSGVQKSLAKVFFNHALMCFISGGFSPEVANTWDFLSAGFLAGKMFKLQSLIDMDVNNSYLI
jgi:hypothetical protein